jgi:RNA polymerase sigma-70 factor (ECF subfamily)
VNGADEELAREAKRGSQAAFESLVRRNQSLVRGFLRRMTADASAADDLAQETFVMAWRKIRSFEEKGSFRGWLCRIAYTQFLQARRSSQAALRRDTAAFADMDQDVSEGAGVEARLDVERAMKALSPQKKPP